jgi:serine protease inhibitor
LNTLAICYSSFWFIVPFYIYVSVSAKTSLTDKESATAVAKANNDLTSKLYGRLVSNVGNHSNMVASPFSISAVMAMVYAGARGNTNVQIKSVLSYPEKDLVLQEGYEVMFKLFQSNENYTLEAANKLFVQKDFKLLQVYTALLEKHYSSVPETVDFLQSEKARGIINTWVEKQTKDKIKDLITKETLDDRTRLVLVTAVYFKGTWKKKFNKADTQKKKFATVAGAKVDVDMMHMNAEFMSSINKDLECTILEMPYKADRLSMLFFLSQNPKGFDAMETKFASVDFLNLKMHRKMRYNVSLPKFKLESSHDLIKNLKAIGLTDMFDKGKADFSGIDGTKNLYVGSVMQKAIIEVNEEGSEADAATEVEIRAKYLTPKFTCDRPFLFAIKDNLSGMVLFTGRVVNPAE